MRYILEISLFFFKSVSSIFSHIVPSLPSVLSRVILVLFLLVNHVSFYYN